jgi:exopolyphosphatase/guanosine-5'-triphosphate,3'-diphosphate pyrophosphatase
VGEQAGIFAGVRPSFARPGTARDGRVAVVDVGSNSVRLVVFEGAERSPSYFFNEKVACGLGAEIARTGRLAEAGRRSALETLTRFAALADRMRVTALDAVATAAIREAEDGAEFCAAVRAATGMAIRIISGDEEARLSAQGVLLAEPKAEGIVVDMGGASMELAHLSAGVIGARITLGLGPQRLAGLEGSALLAAIDAEIARGQAALGINGAGLILVGGAWRTFAKVQMQRTSHPLQVLHGYRMTGADTAEAAAWVARQPADTLKGYVGVSGQRAATAPLAALVLSRLIAALQPPVVTISAFGLREGIYHEMLPPAVRRRDPLIDACQRLEARQARFPGFGAELAAFVSPLLGGWPPGEARLAHAACLLTDVNWRAHPDYRPLSCFETVTRANLTGLDHAERVFIGFALLNRYGGGKYSADVAEALRLLDAPARSRAKALGRALRLGAMLSASTPGALAAASLHVQRDGVTLHLSPALQPLIGQAVERRAAALAAALGLPGASISAETAGGAAPK